MEENAPLTLPRPSLHDPVQLRIRIIVSAAIVLIILNIGYIYDATNTVNKNARLVEISSLIADLLAVKRNLDVTDE